ncbi:MAG: response regulator [Verrucomicrobia bacterium]|nr:response regulator [Verrucomicrobiota bacterium]
MTTSLSRLLVVEDNPQLSELLVAGLEQDDVTVESVANGLEALAWMRQQKFDAALLDLGLPGLDGTEVLRQLKSDHASAHIPVIVMSGRQEASAKLRTFELGATDFISKPFELVELRARVRSVLKTKRLQDDLTEANQMLKSKADFLAKTSHEIRTQLGAVTALTGLLLQTDLSAQQRDYVETVFNCGESLLTLLNDILNVSKIEAGKLELEQRPFHLRLCVDEALDLLAAKCTEKNLDLICDFEGEVPEQVIGDVTRLRQILFNLVSNAVKFTEAGEVVLGVRAQAPAVPGGAWEFHFSVRDSGIGIPPDRLGRLFQSFAQADISTTREFGGTGLGLFISKGLVELMGGKLWAESTPGAGSNFQFTIPLPTAPQPEPAAWQKAQAQWAGRRVLIVDDNATSARLLARQIQRWSLTARTVESAVQALEVLRTEPGYDAVVIDASMPKMDGLALAREIRKLPAWVKVPLVLLAPLGMKTGTPEMAQAGIQHHVNKPVKPALLHSALHRALAAEGKTDFTTEITKRPAPAASKLDSTLGARSPLRILLTDDNAINIKVASKMLNQLGYKPDIANNGVEAVAAVQRQPYDVVLMDVQMPQMDGLEATRRIRAWEKENGRAPVSIVAMTANAMSGDREKCLAAGMNEYLAKPVRPDALQKTLETLASSRRTEAAAPAVAAPVAPAASVSIEPAPVASAPPAPLLSASPAPLASPVLSPLSTVAKPPVVPLPAAAVEKDPGIDMDRLNEFSGGDADSLNEIIDLFLRQTGDQLQEMQRQVSQQNKPEVARLAHTCAGASAICGMNSLVPLVRDLERRSLNGGGPEMQTVLDQMGVEFQRITRFLQKIRAKSGQPSAAPVASQFAQPVMAMVA